MNMLAIKQYLDKTCTFTIELLNTIRMIFNNSKKPKFKAAYGTAKKARNTLKRLRRATHSKAQQVARTMYYRAKYHKYQTPGMKAAMKVYSNYLTH
jgi:hypothetical protein